MLAVPLNMSHYVYFGPTSIGRIDNVFEHQGAFFGDFQLDANREMDNESERLLLFIDFCRDWFGAQKALSPPEASRFDQFEDLIGHGFWTLIDEWEQQHMIADAPMFSGGRHGEISWNIASQ